MPQATVEEILKASGLTDEQVKALDAKVTGALTQVLSTASQTLEQAELAKRAQAQQYDTEIAPRLDQWANEQANLTAERDYYKTLATKAKEGGFVATAEPFTPPATPGSPVRNTDGTFRPSGTPPPPGPDPVKALRDELGGAFAFLADTSWKYRSLYGTEMPDSPTAIIREAAAQRRSPAEYAAIKYDFAGKEKAKREADQKTHDDAIRKEAKDASDREWAERVSSNPMIRQAETSRFAEVHKAVKEGARPDPLKMPTRELRHKETQQRIQKEIAENATIQ